MVGVSSNRTLRVPNGGPAGANIPQGSPEGVLLICWDVVDEPATETGGSVDAVTRAVIGP
jgi:hypothetical protein